MDFEQADTTMCAGLNASELLALYRLEATDLVQVRNYGHIVLPRIDESIERFYTWMEGTPEFSRYFADASKLHSVQALQRLLAVGQP